MLHTFVTIIWAFNSIFALKKFTWYFCTLTLNNIIHYANSTLSYGIHHAIGPITATIHGVFTSPKVILKDLMKHCHFSRFAETPHICVPKVELTSYVTKPYN